VSAPNPGRSIFLGIMGAPYESELTTTLLRLVGEALRQGHRVLVYACGGATALTLRGLGESKPRSLHPPDVAAGQRDYPTTARLVGSLLTAGNGRLRWYVCSPCLEERGALDQMEGVIVHTPFRLVQCMARADVALFMGVK
jgi:hypothetical protein